MKLYLEILMNHFNEKHERNPRYSLRAFSIDAGLKPGRMSDMFKGRYGLSREVARAVARNLKFSSEETKKFLLSVEASHARDEASKKKAQSKLDKINSIKADKKIDVDQFSKLKSWYSLAITELLKKNPNYTVDELSKRLDVSTSHIVESLARLQKTKLLDEKGRLTLKKSDLLSVENKKSSELIKNYHLEMMDKARHALYHDPIDSRDFSSCQVLIESEKLEEAKEYLLQTRREFIRKFGNANNNSSLYSFCYQLFSIEKTEKEH